MNISPLSPVLSSKPPSGKTSRVVPTTLGLTIDDIEKLLPKASNDIYGNIVNGAIVNIWDILPDWKPNGKAFPLADILRRQYNFSIMLFQFNQNSGLDRDSGDGYEKYLQYPSHKLQALAHAIVDRTDSDDEKVYKIEQWVIKHLEYVSDIKNYGLDEYWSYPTVTLMRERGDCEDGAFLIHSLALHAGVSIHSLRTYGGIVQEAGGPFILGGHAWTAYKRESDREWVVVDWSYYPTDTPLSERVAMKNDTKYVDDFFYLDALKTVDTSLLNRIRNPVGGKIINIYA